MCGLLRPDAGTVELDGRPVGALAREGHAAIGVAPQELVIWEQLTCFEQFRFTGCLYDLSRRDASRDPARVRYHADESSLRSSMAMAFADYVAFGHVAKLSGVAVPF